MLLPPTIVTIVIKVAITTIVTIAVVTAAAVLVSDCPQALLAHRP